MRTRLALRLHHSWGSLTCRVLLLGALSVACGLPTPTAAAPIRVLLLQHLADFALAVPPDYSIQSQPSGVVPADDGQWRTLRVQASAGKIRLPELGSEVRELRLTPRRSEALIYVGSKLYRGSLDLKWREGGISIINTLDLEEYLYGVVPMETPTQWEMAALQAQAVVARTYASYKRLRQTSQDYDVAAEYVRDQRYEGFGAERPRTTQAVNDTKGLVLTCRGELIPAYYHAESAGYTENSENVWSASNPCLRAVKAQIYPASPYLQWSVSLSLQEIRAALVKHGYSIGQIRRLEPVGRSPTGRITRLKISHNEGETLLRGTDFRLALGPEVIRSTLFTVQIRDSRAYFQGQGWGHGVGLCQWCSQGMAELGYDYEAILTHYYQGAKLIHYQ